MSSRHITKQDAHPNEPQGSDKRPTANRYKVNFMSRIAAALIIMITVPSVAIGAAPRQTTSIYDITNRQVDTGGLASLRRSDDMFRINVSAVGLTPNHAYVLLLVVFNNPNRCKLDVFPTCDYTADSNALGGDPLVTSTTVYLTGGFADVDGTASFNGKLEEGAVGLAGREVLEGTGVYNMAGAQMQVIIRDKGPASSNDDGYSQITERGSCDANTTCQNVQIATFD